MKYLVKVTVPFGMHRKGDQLTVDVDFLALFGKYTKTIAEIDEPEEPSLKPPLRKQKKAPAVEPEVTDGQPSGDLHSEG